MKNRISLTLSFFALMHAPFVFGQQEQTLNFLTDTWQAHLTNPALLPSKKIAVALPSVYFNINSPDLVVKDLMVQENGLQKLSLKNLYNPQRAEVTHLNAHVQVQTLGISFPVSDKLSLSVYQAGSVTPSVNYRRDLAQLFFKGNADFVGKTTAFGSSAQADMRSEIGIGATYRLPALTLGGRIKLHSGIAGIFTQADKLDIAFSATDYSLAFNTDLDVRTFASDKVFKIKNAQDVVSQGLFSKNRGISFDLGGSMQLGKLQLNASLIDIAGSINWKNDGTTYTSKGNYTFKGRDESSFQQFFKVDSLSSKIFTDTLKKIVGLTETASATYTQKLPMKLYLSGAYKINDKIVVNLLIYNESGGFAASQTGCMIGGAVTVFEKANILKIRTGLSYGLRNGQFNNLGAHITVNAAKFIQVFGVTDNVFHAFRPYNSYASNGRVGMGLIF